MKSAKALAAVGVTFLTAIIEYLAPGLPKELIVAGAMFLSALAVYFIPNKE